MAGLTKRQREHMAAMAQQKLAQDAGHLREFFNRFDVGEFTARGRSAEMVNILADFAADTSLDRGFRRDCAKDVLDRAWGTVQPKLLLQDINPGAPVEPGGTTVEVHINSAMEQTAWMIEKQKYIGRPLEEWPQRLLDETNPADLAIWESLGDE